MQSAPSITPSGLADLLARWVEPDQTLIVGITGSVAVGKSALADRLAEYLRGRYEAAIINTDGFLQSNAMLEARGLMGRKGFPETLNRQALVETLLRARSGAVEVPVYCHRLSDVDPSRRQRVERVDILLVEGLGFAPAADGVDVMSALDSLMYIDAAEHDLERWFSNRFMHYWRDAETNADSFYRQYRTMSEPEAVGFAAKVWREINLPNLCDHIVKARPLADIQLWKDKDHHLHLVKPEWPKS